VRTIIATAREDKPNGATMPCPSSTAVKATLAKEADEDRMFTTVAVRSGGRGHDSLFGRDTVDLTRVRAS
jgi:hypothetical protein